MRLLPIDVNEANNALYRNTPESLPILDMYPDFYRKVGFAEPWIGYFAADDNSCIVGTGGYKGAPKNGRVEIAYHTFENYEGRGIGTEICRQLVRLALQSDSGVRVTARTLTDGYASIAILRKNGFQCLGTVQDDDDGEVLEWSLVSGGQ